MGLSPKTYSLELDRIDQEVRADAYMRHKQLDDAIARHDSVFLQNVSASKPMIDFFGLIITAAISAGAFCSIVAHLTKAGWSTPLFCGAVFCAVYWCHLFLPLIRANDAFVDGAILKGIRLFGLPSQPDIRSTTFRALFRTCTWIISYAIIIGTFIVAWGLADKALEKIIPTIAAPSSAPPKQSPPARSPEITP